VTLDLASLAPLQVESAGCRISYRVVGEGPPLLLVMGLGADGVAWQDHAQAYVSSFRCIIPDNRGAGLSEAPTGPYSSAQMAADCAAVVRTVVDEPVAVVGISMGGIIAQELALRHPGLVRRLVLVSSWSRCDPYLVEMFDHLRVAQRALAQGEFDQLLQLRIWSPEYFSAHAEDLRSARGQQMAPTANAFAAQCAACISHDARERLSSVEAQTLITGGQQDSFTPIGLAIELHQLIPNSQLEIFPGGHAHHWEHLDRFNRLLLSWLQHGSVASVLDKGEGATVKSEVS
jgi:pimeloyl-ACP methyl ester carboxylesterase